MKQLLLLGLLLPYAYAEYIPVPTWKMLESMDFDKNDLIDREEFLSSDRVFDFIDADKNQLLSAEELKKARKTLPAAPKKGNVAPELEAYDPVTEKMVQLSKRDKPLVLIFGTHT